MEELIRQTREEEQRLFEVEPDWRMHWWGMPLFEMKDARPRYSITVNFMTAEDVRDFALASGCKVNPRSRSAWFPHQDILAGGSFFYDGPPTDSRYPVCIPSKGRAKYQTTGHALKRLGVSHKFFVEETEYDDYCEAVGEDLVVRLPFHDLGQGSIPARNFIWDWAIRHGHRRFWTVDDNIKGFYRCTANRRLMVRGGGFFRAMEDFVDRYENVRMAGPHHVGFVPDRDPGLTPVLWNSRVYSCILLDASVEHRWRGRYNEDTDLSLRILKDGECTLLFRALMMAKGGTVGNKGVRAMPGGNTDNVYNGDDKRLAFAKSLEEQHPDVVKVVWKFNRWHHSVDYGPFRRNKPIVRAGIVPTPVINDYEMVLVRATDVLLAKMEAEEGPTDTTVEAEIETSPDSDKPVEDEAQEREPVEPETYPVEVTQSNEGQACASPQDDPDQLSLF